MNPTTPPPHQIAREAANQIAAMFDVTGTAHMKIKLNAPALILSAAAKMVQQSGAVDGLDMLLRLEQEPDNGSPYSTFYLKKAEVSRIRASLQSLRSLSEGEAKQP